MVKHSAPGPDSVGDTAAGMGSGCPPQEEPQDQGQLCQPRFLAETPETPTYSLRTFQSPSNTAAVLLPF